MGLAIQVFSLMRPEALLAFDVCIGGFSKFTVFYWWGGPGLSFAQTFNEYACHFLYNSFYTVPFNLHIKSNILLKNVPLFSLFNNSQQ
jgi:hypothetical protein